MKWQLHLYYAAKAVAEIGEFAVKISAEAYVDKACLSGKVSYSC